MKQMATWAAVLTGMVLLTTALGAAAQNGTTSSSADAAATRSVRQNVDIPRDNVLAALALGFDGDDILDIANFDRSVSSSSRFSRSVDLDDDDILLALALSDRGGLDTDDLFLLDRGFGFSRFDRDFDDLDDLDDLDDFEDRVFFDRSLRGFDDDDLFLSDLDGSSTGTFAIRQNVNLDRDDVLFALALGEDDLEDILDFDRTTTRTRALDRDIDFDRDDALLALALD